MENTSACSRRGFLATTLSSGAVLAAGGLSGSQANAAAESRVAFVTANLVARVSGYRFKLANWADEHKKTVAATDEAEWRAICKEIADHGFKAIEIWEAHAAPEVMDKARGATWKAIMDDLGLKAVGYGGKLTPKTAEICQWLGIPQINGWLGDNNPKQATDLCKQTGVRVNIENHPQKSAKELFDAIGGGNEWLGVCVDTGWFGTQGVSAPDMIRECGKLVRNVHIKDVKAAGAHDTCLLGEGVVGIADCIAALKEIGYAGWYAWEDEPEDRNPFDSADRNKLFIEKLLA